MAKKAKTEGVLARATRQKAEDEAVVAAARQAEADARAAKDAERATAEAAEAAKQAAAGSGRKRAAKAAKAEPAAKKVRYVREKKEATPLIWGDFSRPATRSSGPSCVMLMPQSDMFHRSAHDVCSNYPPLQGPRSCDSSPLSSSSS